MLSGGVSKETGIPDGFMGLDCGPKSIEENAQAMWRCVCGLSVEAIFLVLCAWSKP